MKFKLDFLKHYNNTNGIQRRKPSFIEILLAMVLIAALATILYNPPARSISEHRLQAGDIVRDDIVIENDITVEDRETTEEKKQAARQKVVPVYEYYADSRQNLIGLLSQWYQLLRQSRKDYIKNKDDLPAIREAIATQFGLQMDRRDIRSLVADNTFSRLPLDELVRFLSAFLDRGILASKMGMQKGPEGTIKVVSKEADPLVLPADTIYDVKEVGAALREFLQSRKDLSKQDVALLTSVLMEFIDVNLAYSQTLTRDEEQRVVSQVNPVIIKLKSGKIILRKGDEVQPEDMKILRLIAAEEKIRKPSLPRFYLILFIVGCLYISLNLLLRVWQSRNQNRKKLFIAMGATLFLSVMVYRGALFLFPLILKNISLEVSFAAISIFFAVPFAFGALVIAFTFDLPSAVLYSFVNAIFSGILCDWDFRIVIYVLLGNVVVSFGIEQYQRIKRSPILKASILWLLPMNLIFVLILSFTEIGLGMNLLVFNLMMAAFSAILSPVLATFIIPLWEIVFKLITDLKLIELNNLNLPIFREMLEKAPGTYHHSQMVATLSETAALDLGLSPLFLTSMALYHDIGKIENPQFFTENNTLYPDSPHKNLSPQESAKVIKSHISEGQERAKKLNLPVEVASAIDQHHGTKLVRYFYDKALEAPGVQTDDLDENLFRYAGRKPQNIENAIIMLADQVEAASKSLGKPSDEEIRNVVQKIIDGNVEEKQFDECEGLTFKSLNIIANGFLKKLSSIYHMRVSYPGFNFKENAQAEDTNP